MAQSTLHTWSLRQRLFAGLGTLSLLICAVAGVGMESARRLGATLRSVTQKSGRQVQLAARLQSGFQEMRTHAQSGQIALVIEMLIHKHQESVDGFHAQWKTVERTKHSFPGVSAPAMTEAQANVPSCASCHDDGMLNIHLQRFEAAGQAVASNLEELSALAPQSVALAQKVDSDIRQWRATYAEYVRIAKAGRLDEAHELITGKILPLLKQAAASASELEVAARLEMEVSNRQGERGVQLSREISTGLGLICLCVAAIVFRVVLGCTNSLKSLARELISLAGSLTHTGRQVAASGVELERSAVAQAGSLNAVASDACQMSKLAVASALQARTAQECMEQASKGTVAADKAVVSLQEAMNGLEGSTRLIAGTLRSINEIAFQTNLLALNASVEAARSGQAGLGFAVVAGEIRTLSERCSEAASQTAALVAEIQAHSKAGKDRLAVASGIIHDIETSTGAASAALNHISDAIKQQSGGTTRVDSMIRQAAGVATQNLALSEQSREGAHEVQIASETLGGVIAAIGRLVGISNGRA